MTFWLLPERLGEQEYDCKDFETPRKHQKRQDPFSGVGYGGEIFAIAGQ